MKGRFCEAVATHALLKKNYKIIKKNYHCIHGEVDIIISKGYLVIFIEVKAWDIYDDDALSKVISHIKLRRLELCSDHFFREVLGGTVARTRMYVRIDVILVQMSYHRLVHYKGV